MTASSPTELKSIPQRKDIEEKHKWDLTVLYKNDDDWEAGIKKGKEIIGEAGKYAGRLQTSPEILFECLEKRSELSLLCHCLYQYARLNQDLDNRISKYQAMSDKAARLSSEASAAFAFVEPELLKIEDKMLLELAGKFPKTDIYDFYIKELIRSRKHIRSTEVEELLAQSGMIARGPDSIYTMFDDADASYPSITDEKGNEVQLTKQRFIKFMDSSDQRVRRDAHNGMSGVYKEHINTLGATLAAEINKNIFYARARKFDSCLHHSLDTFNIPISVYKTLIETTESQLEGLHKWMGLRKKILKLDKLYPYDVYNPLFPEQDYDVPYDEAVTEVIAACTPLGKEYVKALKKAFADRWVDVYETEGKGGGAYNWGNYAAHPFVKMNFNNTIGNMFTLAHEMGHALHSHLSCKNQPFEKSQYSIFVAEVASTLNEGLLRKYLLGKTDDKKQKLFLLNRHINNTFTTYFHQVMYGHFELMIHELVESGGAFSPDKGNEFWEELTLKYYGPVIEMDEYSKYKWSRIPHFYTNYYVYQYATSYAASQAIFEKFTAGKKGIIDKFLELLKSGGSDYPIEQLKKCGVNMTTSEPFEATLKLFAKQVDEIERLTE
jgi:oligoendopeptidase F